MNRLTYLLTIDEEFSNWELEDATLKYESDEIRRLMPEYKSRYHPDERTSHWDKIRKNNIKQINLRKKMQQRVLEYKRLI